MATTTKSRTPLWLLAAGLLAAPVCALDPPKSKQGDGGSGPGICGTTGQMDGGVDVPADDADNTKPDAPEGDSAMTGGGGGGASLVVTPVACNAGNATLKLKYTDGYTPKDDDLAKVQTLIAQMSLTERATQMRGMPYGSAGKTQMNDTQRSKDTKNIRGYHYRDASRGVN